MSVHQNGIIFYGDNLLEWVAMEFLCSSDERDRYFRTPSAPRPVVPFWTDVVEQMWMGE